MNKLVMVVVLLVSSVAFADEAADRVKAMNAVFTAQTSKLAESDEYVAALQKTLAKDAIVSWGQGGAPTTDARSWIGDATKVKVLGSKAGWAGTYGWLVAELRINYTWYAEGSPQKAVGTYHYLGVFVADGKEIKAKVIYLAVTSPDSKLTPYNYVAKLPKLASPSASVALLAQPKEIAAHLSTDPATTIVGTSDKDHAFGAAAAKKLVASWSKLELELVEAGESENKASYVPVEIAAGDATIVWARLRMKLKKAWYPLDAIAVLRKNGDKTEVVALSYGAEP